MDAKTIIWIIILAIYICILIAYITLLIIAFKRLYKGGDK